MVHQEHNRPVKSFSELRKPSHSTRLALIGIAFFIIAVAPLVAGVDLPLSKMQHNLLLQRVQRFADRYYPSLDQKQREAIANSASVSGASRRVAIARFQSIAGFVGAIGCFAWGLRVKQKLSSDTLDPELHPILKTMYKRVFLCAFLLLVVAGTSWQQSKLERRFDGAGAFVDDGMIKLVSTNRTQEQLIGIWDHELTHLFGKGRFNKIGRDAWLAYAYQAVLALERGGPPALSKSSLNAGFDQRNTMYFFYRGVLGNAAFPHDPELAEGFVLNEVTKTIGPVQPDVDTDDPYRNLAFAANWASAVGLAGVAWMAAKGDADTALLYLDEHGRGMTASETVRDLEIRAPQHVNHDNSGMTPLILEAREAVFKNSDTQK